MKKRLLLIPSVSLLLGLVGCAHQSAGAGGYAGMAFGDCEFEADCYGGPETTPYSCVFVQSPSMPARMAITVPRHHPSPRVVERDWTAGNPSNDSSVSASASSPPPPAPVSREPVVLASPSGGDRTPRTPN